MTLISNGLDNSALSHQIAEALSEEILSGKYLPGSRIKQDEIAEKYKASRSPVREALQMLASAGLVRLIAHTGAWVAELSLNECEEMYLIRENIEPLMLRFSLPNLNVNAIKELDSLCKKMEANSDPEKFLKLDREFHLLSYQGAETALLGEMVHRMWNTTQHYRRAYTVLLQKNSFVNAHYEHHLLVAAIQRHDVDDAARVLFGHIRRTRVELANHPELFTTRN